MFDIGPRTRAQMNKLGSVWRQGEFILITGPTGSGKTTLARQVVQQRLNRRGYVAVFVGKLGRDETIERDYRGWTRWKTWKDSPNVTDNKVLLWPDTDRYKQIPDKRAHQREVFERAFNRLANVGEWTIQVDEGLYTVNPSFLNLGDHLSMLHAMGRSSRLTMVTLAQRPAHLPLIVYSSASHVFAGRAREEADRKRLAEVGGMASSRELGARISKQKRHEFTWIPVAQDWPPETVDLSL